MTTKRTVLLGHAGVDSGQLMITDPSYIDSQWLNADEAPLPNLHPVYEDADGNQWQYGEPDMPNPAGIVGFAAYDVPIPGKKPNDLIASGAWKELPSFLDDEGEFSYRGACQRTLSGFGGSLRFKQGHEGAGVAFQTGYGDGTYPVYAEIITENGEERVSRVYIDFINP